MTVVDFIKQDDSRDEILPIVVDCVGHSWAVDSLDSVVGVVKSKVAFPIRVGGSNPFELLLAPLHIKTAVLKLEVGELVR